MKPFITFCMAMLLISGSIFAQPPDTLWIRTFGGINHDYGKSVQQTSDGGFIVVGETETYGAGMSDVYLIKTDEDGYEVLWQTYGGSDYDYGKSVQQTTDGGYIIVGNTHSFGAGDYDVYLIKTDANGNETWHRTFGGSDHDEGESVQQTSDGGYIIAGYTDSYGVGDYDVYLIKTDANGNETWHRTFGGTNDDRGYSVQQTSDGGYIIAGWTLSFGSGYYDFYLIRTDEFGNELWAQTYGGTDADQGYSVQQTSDGNFITAGLTGSYSAGWRDVYLIKVDAWGDEIWSQNYGGDVGDYGYSVQQTSDGGYIIAGRTDSYGAGDYDVYLIKTNSLGNETWWQTYGGSSGDYGNSVQQTSDGGYIIAGWTYSFGAGGSDVYLIRLEGEPSAPPPSLTITLTPHDPPIQIPSGGGSFLYDIFIENNDSIGVSFDGWTMAIMPDSSFYSPIILRTGLFLSPGGIISRDSLNQFVPAGAPPGDYSYVGNVGLYPDEIFASDSIDFEKLPGDGIPTHNQGWALFGWDDESDPATALPIKYATISAYPNPFNPETNLTISLQLAADVTLSIYDTQGREVASLMNAWYPSGTYQVSFDGSQLSSGMYFASLRANEINYTVKLLLIK